MADRSRHGGRSRTTPPELIVIDTVDRLDERALLASACGR
jgi:hypothetical protein